MLLREVRDQTSANAGQVFLVSIAEFYTPRVPPTSRILKNSFLPRLLKKVQIQGGITHPADGYPGRAPTEGGSRRTPGTPHRVPKRANVVDGPFSTAC